MALCERQKDTLSWERKIGTLHGYKIAISKSLTNLTEQLQVLAEKQCKETGEHRWKCQNKDWRTMQEKMQQGKEITFLVKMFMFFEQINLKRYMIFYKWQIVKWKMQELISELDK